MRINIIQVGKSKHQFVKDGENEYLKRLQAFADLNIITLKEASTDSTSQAAKDKSKAEEADLIIKNLPDKSFLIILDEHGKQFTSAKFAEFITQQRDFQGGNVTFVIGGPFGLDTKILSKAKLKLSFSQFTFTHEMIRVLLLEQLYRAFTIIQGRTYHY